jgi:uncharacterized protein YjgD (DUF1641 family)
MTQEKQSGTGAAESSVNTELGRLVASAQDAMTDDMVTRLSSTVSNGLDLLDRVNRSGVSDALPTIAAMVKNGDLARVADLARLIGSAEDSMSDDIVKRLSETAVGGLDLLDRVNRSGILRALPAITQLVENGDLDRLVSLARFVAAMEDSLSDDIVRRIAIVATELATLVDKLARTEGFERLIDILGREHVQDALDDMAEATCAAKAEAAKLAPSRGGIMGLLQMAKDPDTQDALRFMALVSKHLRKLPRS